MKIHMFNMRTLENLELTIPDKFAEDMEHVVVIKDQEFFNLKSTLPDDVRKRDGLRQQFEDNEFEKIRSEFYSDLDENANPEEFEKDFVSKIKTIINDKYPELKELIGEAETNDGIYHTICLHFVVYAIYKNRELHLEEVNKDQKKAECYGIDYAMRLTELFKKLSLDNPESIKLFSDELQEVERFMKNDTRKRHAGYDKLFSGISFMVSKLATIFITDNTKDSVNLVKAFQEAAENNKDRDILVGRINETVDGVVRHFNSMIENVKSIEPQVARAHSDLATAYLMVARGLVVQFVTATEKYVKNFDENKMDESRAYATVYHDELKKFCVYLDDLIMAYDDVTANKETGSENEKKLFYIWSMMNEGKESHKETWPAELANTYVVQFKELFDGVPMVNPETKRAEE